jgi:hypothetical protein
LASCFLDISNAMEVRKEVDNKAPSGKKDTRLWLVDRSEFDAMLTIVAFVFSIARRASV